MQVLDRAGLTTVWAACKEKFAPISHSHSYVPLSGGTMTGNLLFSNSGTALRGIQGICGDNDYWRVMGAATGSNAGYMEIATADDGTEPIYVRQYTGVYTSLKRTATLLDANGNTSFPGTVTAPTFSGNLSGNASTATKVGTATVGSATKPVYINAGTPTAINYTLGNACSKTTRTLTSVSHSSWKDASTDQGYVPDMAFIAYWNGAYSSSGSSNIQYCYKGKFGNLAVKDSLSKSDIGLGSVDNTADANKSVKYATSAGSANSVAWGNVSGKPTMPTNITATKAQIVTISGSTVTVNASLDSYKTPGEFNIYGTSSGDYAKMYVQSGIADSFNGTRVITQTIKITISHSTYAEVCDVTRQYKSNAWSAWSVMYLGND